MALVVAYFVYQADNRVGQNASNGKSDFPWPIPVNRSVSNHYHSNQQNPFHRWPGHLQLTLHCQILRASIMVFGAGDTVRVRQVSRDSRFLSFHDYFPGNHHEGDNATVLQSMKRKAYCKLVVADRDRMSMVGAEGTKRHTC